MNPASRRYKTSGLAENQPEPDSRGRVLKNLLGITSVRAMELAESRLLLEAERVCARRFGLRHRFTDADIQAIHGIWLGSIYSWAGKYRNVDMSKGGHRFAVPGRIPGLMHDLGEGPLQACTPCRGMSPSHLAAALAEVHVELVLIHPFREGNGRLARVLANLMARQAGYHALDYSPIHGRRKRSYIVAIQSGMGRDYRPMTNLFNDILLGSR